MPTRTSRAANQTVQGASKQSSSFTVPSGDLIVVSAAAGRETDSTALDITITDSVGLSWSEPATVNNVSSNSAAVSEFHAVSTGASMTVTVAATGATAIGYRVDSFADWTAVINGCSAGVDYGVTTLTNTFGSTPASDSLCIGTAHRQQPNYDHGTGVINTPGGWALIELIEFQHAVDRWLQFKIYERTGSTSTSAGTTASTGEQDSLTGAAIEITAGGGGGGGGGNYIVQENTDLLFQENGRGLLVEA